MEERIIVYYGRKCRVADCSASQKQMSGAPHCLIPQHSKKLEKERAVALSFSPDPYPLVLPSFSKMFLLNHY